MSGGSSDSFVHLHVHTEYSMLDGAARLDEMFARTAELGMGAIAMTDHGNVFGAHEFWSKAKAHGVKPIIGCLVAGQEIVTARGVVPVEEIVVGDRVLTHLGRFKPVVRTMRRPYSGRAYTVGLAGRYGRTLTLTEEHPILVRTSDGLVDWKKPADVPVETRARVRGVKDWASYVCLPRLKEQTTSLNLLEYLPADFRVDAAGAVSRDYESKYRASHVWPRVPTLLALTDELGYLMGMFAAEGSLGTRRGELTGDVTFSLHASELAYADQIEKIAEGFGAETRRYKPKGRPNSLEVHFACLPLAYMLRHLIGSSAAGKRVPEEVLNAPESVRRAFVSGMLDGDGKQPSESNPSGRRDLKTASPHLAWGLRTMLADLGHWATVSTGSSLGDFPQGPSNHRYNWYYVAVTFGRKSAYTFSDDEFTYKPIRSVTPVDLECDVYNFEVEGDNSYVSDFVLHNCEVYATPNTSRFERKRVRWNNGGDDDVSGGGAFTHMTMLAETTAGMHNLFKMSSRASLEGYFYKPRVERELMAEYASGLIATTGCPSGEVQTWLRIGDYAKAREAAGDFQDIFGKDNFFLELMDHGLSIESRVRADLLKLGRDLGLPLVATNDSHYTREEDAPSQEHLLCINSGSTMSDPKRFK
ncbi:MAG TPA: PHP domain-containing protein, partial [Nocardioidaceae bacterium]|nr:PHP domain-containing protein [Nocardioidaceae bacterium]